MTRISLLKPQDMRHWLRLYRLYRSAFPREERKPFSIIRRMFREGRTDVWCICRGKEFLGLATTVNGDGLILLDYLAVDCKAQGQGIGSEALAMLQQMYAHCGLFVEIESTRETAPNREERLRRMAFYRRGGMEPLGVWADVFGVKMELLGSRCEMDFAAYQGFYKTYYSPWAAKHILEDFGNGKRIDA